jgi:predicted AAA+ superfamily ATPase
MLSRLLADRLPRSSPPRRLVVLTGARQVGKTTLARDLYGEDLLYLNLDSPGERGRLAGVPAEGWAKTVGPAILDEVQKVPDVLEKIKWAYDDGKLDFSVLLGSSRILLLDQIRESLAGRVFLYELWPLTVTELSAWYGGELCRRPLVVQLAQEPERALARLAELAGSKVGPAVGAAQSAVRHLLEWGGLPSLLEYKDGERQDWLESYQATYLERDLADLARLRDLEPFVTCHRLAALRAGCLLSYSDLARDAALPVTTVRRYLRYLELSYQTLRLPAWTSNRTVRLVKAPKLIWFDLGVQRVLSGQLRGLTGEQYESAIISQILTTLQATAVKAASSHLRTSSKLEVDLILEPQDAILAFEVKGRTSVRARDAGPIERARGILGERYRAGIVVYRGERIEQLTETVFAVPDWWLLGFED